MCVNLLSSICWVVGWTGPLSYYFETYYTLINTIYYDNRTLIYH